MKRVSISTAVLVVALFISASHSALGQSISATLTLDGSVSYQTISGWEATAQAGQAECAAFPAYKDELFDRAVDELGLTRLRLEVKSGVENTADYYAQWLSGKLSDALWRQYRYATVNDNNDPNVINWSGFHFTELDEWVDEVVLPVKQRLESRGEHLFLNVNYVAFTGQIGSGLFYGHDNAQEYAEFVLAVYLHLQQKYGLVPDAWEVILEPDNTSQWTGQYIGQAIVATAKVLEAHGFTPSFIVPSTTNMSKAVPYFDAMMGVQGMKASWIRELSYHRYGGVSQSALQGIATRGQQYGVGTAMLEHIGSGYEDLHEDLKVGGNEAWQQFTLGYCVASGSADNGGSYYRVDESAAGGPKVELSARAWYLRQYFLRVRPGAHRIGAATTSGSFDPVAFVNKDGGYAVVVKAGSGGTVLVKGLPAGRYGIGYATASEPDGDGGEVVITAGQNLQAYIPNQGVLSVYSR